MANAPRALLFLALVAIGCGAARVQDDRPLARDGVIDLRDWDFAARGPILLEGDWAFRYGDLTGPALLVPGVAPTGPWIAIPRPWNAVRRGDGALSGLGFASHGLRILLPGTESDLAIQLGEANSAERLFVNGQVAMERGQVGMTRVAEVPDVQGRVVPLGPLSGPVDLVLEISNYLHFEGGPVRSARLGLRDDLHRRAERDARVDFLVLGCLLVLGLFYAAMSVGRPDREIALFAALTLILALRTATTKWYITAIFPFSSEDQLRIDYMTFILLPLVFAHLMSELFPQDVPGLLLRASYLEGVLGLAAALFLKPWIFTQARDVFIVLGATFAACAVFFVAVAALRRRKGASTLLVFSLLALLVGLRDAAIGMRLLPDARELLPIANGLLVFAHAVILGRRLTEALGSTQRLASSLKESNELLEQRIAERTQDLERVAMTDPLTGLWNRRSLLKLAEAERARASRSGERIGVMMIDCDNFKMINDVHGHEAGDEALRALSQRFSALVRTQDLIGRWGGEEFLMIFSTADREGALAAAERVRKDVADLPFDVSASVSLQVTVSIGVALLRAGDSVQDVIRAADESLYLAKESGRNCVVLFSGR